MSRLIPALFAAYLAAAPAYARPKEPEEMQYAMRAVEDGTLEYSRNCGWIDWGHSIPDSPRALLDTLLNESGKPSADGKYYEITYSQTMKKVMLGREIVAGIGGRYNIRRGLSKREKVRVAYAIFKDISYRFEQFQGDGLCGFVTSHSSFSEEDLPSDLMSFNRARYRLSREDMEEICDAVGKVKSRKILEKGEYGKENKVLKPIIRNRGRRTPYKMLPPQKPQRSSYQTLGYDSIYDVI